MGADKESTKKKRPAAGVGLPLFSLEKRKQIVEEGMRTSYTAVALKYNTRVENVYRWRAILQEKGLVPRQAEAPDTRDEDNRPAGPVASTPSGHHIVTSDEHVKRLHEIIGRQAAEIERLKDELRRRGR